MLDICEDIKSIINENLSDILLLRSTGILKEDNTFVSKGDLLCEKLIFEYLESKFDDYLIISEESKTNFDNIEHYKYIITLDPIDGTENFVSGLKEWGVGVSIYKNMEHYQSMILLPELQLSLCTGDRIERKNGSRICGLSSYMTPADFDNLGKDYEYRIMGCCMYNMYNVIRGYFCRFMHLKGCYSWDILPGLNLALENGLEVILDGNNYTGEFLQPNIKYRFDVH